MSKRPGAGDALLIVDVQRDFCAGGELPVEGGDDVVPIVNRWTRAADGGRVPSSSPAIGIRSSAS